MQKTSKASNPKNSKTRRRWNIKKMNEGTGAEAVQNCAEGKVLRTHDAAG